MPEWGQTGHWRFHECSQICRNFLMEGIAVLRELVTQINCNRYLKVPMGKISSGFSKRLSYQTALSFRLKALCQLSWEFPRSSKQEKRGDRVAEDCRGQRVPGYCNPRKQPGPGAVEKDAGISQVYR
jgi:hypothetical protein